MSLIGLIGLIGPMSLIGLISLIGPISLISPMSPMSPISPISLLFSIVSYQLYTVCPRSILLPQSLIATWINSMVIPPGSPILNL